MASKKNTHSNTHNQASSPSFYYFFFNYLLYIFIHKNTHKHTCSPTNFTLWKDIYPEFFLLLTRCIFPRGQTVCFSRRCVGRRFAAGNFPAFSASICTLADGEDPFYGRKLWVLPGRLEMFPMLEWCSQWFSCCSKSTQQKQTKKV